MRNGLLLVPAAAATALPPSIWTLPVAVNRQPHLEAEGLGDDGDGEDAGVEAGLGETGAAPVPVPPPMPAVMKTMWLPSICSMISSRDSRAAILPASGFAPQPSPAWWTGPAGCSCP